MWFSNKRNIRNEDAPMTGNPDGLRILAAQSSIPVSSIRYMANADAEVVRTIDTGFLFLVAFWSGWSMLAFKTLTQALRDRNSEKLELVAVDVDGSPDVYLLPEIKRLYRGDVSATAPPGAGEAAFYREGKFVHAAILGTGRDLDSYTEKANAFLATCGIE